MEKNPIQLKVRVLEYTEGSFKGKDGSTVQYNSALVRFDGTVLKMTSKADLSKSLDKDVVVDVDVSKGMNDAPKLRIVSLSESK